MAFAHKLDADRYHEKVTKSKDDDLPIFKALKSRISLFSISESALSVKRLGLQRAVLGRRRREFTDKNSGKIDGKALSVFTKAKDPDGIAWECQPKADGRNGFDYIPSESLSDAQYQNLLAWMRS
ncbi:hypothetical protein FLX56_27965, partial [Synechococcus moorigangaii CMS01]|nr:hypothetical protein [Synechococcus moorigangaii CMS01]